VAAAAAFPKAVKLELLLASFFPRTRGSVSLTASSSMNESLGTDAPPDIEEIELDGIAVEEPLRFVMRLPANYGILFRSFYGMVLIVCLRE
jgi:hypothetical protein